MATWVYIPNEILPDNMKPCGKQWYASKPEALAQMRTMKPIRGPKYKLNVYHCYDCDGFHIGHTKVTGNK